MLHCTCSDCLGWVGSGLVCSENVGLGWVVNKVGWVLQIGPMSISDANPLTNAQIRYYYYYYYRVVTYYY